MPADLHEIYPTIVTIKDFPCGSGKTTKMMQELCSEKLYLIVVPLKTEIHRVLSATSHLGFVEPLEAMTPARTKQSALLKLINQRAATVLALCPKMAREMASGQPVLRSLSFIR